MLLRLRPWSSSATEASLLEGLTSDIAGGDVKLIDQYPLYELGAALQLLKSVSALENVRAFDQIWPLIQADNQIVALLDGNPIEISYCRLTAVRLRESITESINTFRDPQTGRFLTDPPPLPEWRMSGIRSAIEIFEHQFSAELKKLSVYAVPRRGIFDTERLVATADEHLPESIRGELPKFVISEFREAGRCLAFGLFSASAFHALRAAEKALREYYTAFLGEPKKEDITMGLMASHLRDRVDSEDATKPKPNAATIRNLADVVSFDRNPLTHKEIQLTEDDAAMLFNRAQGMIALMARELIDRAEELQPELPLGDGQLTGKDLATPAKPRSAKKPKNALLP